MQHKGCFNLCIASLYKRSIFVERRMEPATYEMDVVVREDDDGDTAMVVRMRSDDTMWQLVDAIGGTMGMAEGLRRDRMVISSDDGMTEYAMSMRVTQCADAQGVGRVRVGEQVQVSNRGDTSHNHTHTHAITKCTKMRRVGVGLCVPHDATRDTRSSNQTHHGKLRRVTNGAKWRPYSETIGAK